MEGDDDIATVFRPSKRRKLHRKRVDDLQDGATSRPETTSNYSDQNSGKDEEDAESNVRRRIPQRRRGGGIGFNASDSVQVQGLESQVVSELAPEQQALALEAAKAADMGTRFSKQSGLKVEVDKHMMAYIDAEIARRNDAETALSSHQKAPRDNHARLGMIDAQSSDSVQRLPARRAEGTRETSTVAGALQEVEVASHGALRNGQASAQTKAPKPPRLGPDGKPWRGRRNRRTSDDVARDALVEALLSERTPGQLQHYQDGESARKATAERKAPGTNEDADERALAEFERQAAEAAEERRRKVDKPPGAAQPKDPAMQGLIANGPKLGGSRSQRAKMHAAEAERLKAMGRKA